MGGQNIKKRFGWKSPNSCIPLPDPFLVLCKLPAASPLPRRLEVCLCIYSQRGHHQPGRHQVWLSEILFCYKQGGVSECQILRIPVHIPFSSQNSGSLTSRKTSESSSQGNAASQKAKDFTKDSKLGISQQNSSTRSSYNEAYRQ